MAEIGEELVGVSGFEPPTSTSRTWRPSAGPHPDCRENDRVIPSTKPRAVSPKPASLIIAHHESIWSTLNVNSAMKSMLDRP